MPSRLDWYLVELDRQLSDFPDERRMILLAEVESHLREQIDDMTDSGVAIDEADIEAVRVFGDPAQFADRMRIETKTPPPRESEASLRGTANVIGGALSALAVFALGSIYLQPAFSGFGEVFGLTMAGIVALGAMTARRLTLGSILASLCLGGLLVTAIAGLTMVDFGANDSIDVATVQHAKMVAVDPSVDFPSTSKVEPSRSEEALRALAVPPVVRMVGFAPSAFALAGAAAVILVAAWLIRHLFGFIRRRLPRRTAF